MSETPRRKTYRSDAIDVTFDGSLCYHAARCVRTLPAVFDTSTRPWVRPGNADADEVARVVALCPSGALRFTRRDGGPEEVVPDPPTVTVLPRGPLLVHGRVTLVDAHGVEAPSGERMALCRCGTSRNRPYCDGSHRTADFPG